MPASTASAARIRCASHSAAMNGLAASSPSATVSSSGVTAPVVSASFKSLSVSGVDSASTIMIATSPSSSTRPATTMSNVAWLSCSWVGNATHWSLISATRTPPIGPENGRPASWVDIDAALIATTSYRWSGFSARMVATTWISLRSPLTKLGRSGRSISRHVRIASSDGRPSRRKNEPGIRPTAYIRSSTSTVSGKKSRPSLGCLLATVADRTTVSSSRMASAEPFAWRASRPVSNLILRTPNSPLSITASALFTPFTGETSLRSIPHPPAAVAVVGSGVPALRFRSSPSISSSRSAFQRVAGRSSIEALGQPSADPGTTTEDRPRRSGRGLRDVSYRLFSVITRASANVTGPQSPGPAHRPGVKGHCYLRSPRRSISVRYRLMSVLRR